MPGSSDSDGAIGAMESAGSRSDLLASVRRRFSSSSPSPNAFLTPAFTAAAAAGGSISNSPLNIDPSLLRLTQSRLNRLHFSSSSSSNESTDSNSPSAATLSARRRLQQLLNLRSLSSSSQRSSSQNSLSPIENLQALSLSARSSPSYPMYKNPVKLDVEEDVLVMDELSKSVSVPRRARNPLELLSSSSSSSVNNNPASANFFKTEVCRFWVECGVCRFGSRCQFAHGKEELRGCARPSKLKSESGKQSSTVGSCVHKNKYVRYVSPLSMDSVASSCVAPEVMRKTGAKKMKIIIKAAQEPPELSFSWPPTEDEEAEIQRVLYGPGRRSRRLPVFVEICSSE